MTLTLVQVVVFVFDIIAFSLAVAAEHRRNKATVKLDGSTNYCHYDSDIATGLGASGLLFLLAGQILVMTGTRCLCGGRPMRPSKSRAFSILLFITCWVFFLIAEVCLLAGSVKNSYHTKFYPTNSSKSCSRLRKGVFGAGAAFAFLTLVVSEIYYICYTIAGDDQGGYARDSGVRMSSL